MSIEVLDIKIKPNRTRVGQVKIRYHKLVIKCDIVYFVKENKVWLRMPEFWLTPTKKTPYVFWPDRDTSDAFQELAIKLMFDKYKMDVEKVAGFHKSITKKKKAKKPDEETKKRGHRLMTSR